MAGASVEVPLTCVEGTCAPGAGPHACCCDVVLLEVCVFGESMDGQGGDCVSEGLQEGGACAPLANARCEREGLCCGDLFNAGGLTGGICKQEAVDERGVCVTPQFVTTPAPVATSAPVTLAPVSIPTTAPVSSTITTADPTPIPTSGSLWKFASISVVLISIASLIHGC